MVSNVADIVKAIRESTGLVLVRTESAMGYPIFFPVERHHAINILEGTDKPMDWAISDKGSIIIG